MQPVLGPSNAAQARLRLQLPLAVLLAGLAGCGGPRPAPLRWLQLPVQVPEPAPAAAGEGPALELARELALPASLDREGVVLAEGDTRLRLLPGHRWAEPLRDALPRLLRHDLGLLLGDSRVWLAPAPVPAGWRLQVELQQLQWRADRGVVQLQARWWLTGGGGVAVPARTGAATFDVPGSGAGDEADTIVQAHRVALWRLARHIADSLR